MNDLVNDGKVNLIGTAASFDNGTSRFIKFGHVMHDYSLTPFFPDLGDGSQ